ncbi:hypothetical protein E2C01_092089 [Portunus trituberculatus]|uniref:Uncharacterized protein n=1 Tax=Portunus trituberculatus TaxID=210409 RepID=A0A5B7JJ82_PORTR|nr:hypothetical protein [Portunus trituberculatus]
MEKLNANISIGASPEQVLTTRSGAQRVGAWQGLMRQCSALPCSPRMSRNGRRVGVEHREEDVGGGGGD